MESTYVTVFRTRPKGDFLVQPYRLRLGSQGDARGTAPTLVPKAEFCDNIAEVVLTALDLFRTPVADQEFWRAGYPPLQAWAASVTDDGTELELATLKRHHGGHMGTGERTRILRADAGRLLARRLLAALGEREEDVAEFIRRHGPRGQREQRRPTTACT